MSMPSLNQSIALFFLAESLLYTRKGVLRHITAQHPMESQMRCTRPSDSVLSLQVHEILGHRVGKVLPCQRGLFTNRLCSRDFGEGLCGVCFSRFSQRRWLQGPLFCAGPGSLQVAQRLPREAAPQQGFRRQALLRHLKSLGGKPGSGRSPLGRYCVDRASASIAVAVACRHQQVGLVVTERNPLSCEICFRMLLQQAEFSFAAPMKTLRKIPLFA